MGGLVAVVLVLAAAAPLAYAARHRGKHDEAVVPPSTLPSSTTTTLPQVRQLPTPTPQARAALLQALASTQSVASLQVDYVITSTPPTSPPPTTRPAVCDSLGSTRTPGRITTFPPECIVATPDTTTSNTTGSAQLQLNPLRMTTTAHVNTSMLVTLVVDANNVYESLGSATPTNTTNGQTLSSFAGLVESTLGRLAGAQAMIGLANPHGYLALSPQQIETTAPAGSGEVDGRHVTNYVITTSSHDVLKDPTLSDEERRTLEAALGVLDSYGMTSSTMKVSIDDDGYIVQTVGSDTYADGSTTTFTTTFSHFVCNDGPCPVVTTTTTEAPRSGTIPPTTVAPPTTEAATTVPGQMDWR